MRIWKDQGAAYEWFNHRSYERDLKGERMKTCGHISDFVTREWRRLGTDKEEEGTVGVRDRVWAARLTWSLFAETRNTGGGTNS